MAKATTKTKASKSDPQVEEAIQDQDEVQEVHEVAIAQPASVQTEGTRARRAIMLKQLIPSQDWIMKEVVAKGKGTRALVGRIFGVVTSTSRKDNTLPDGRVTQNVALHGTFSSESYLSGEISEGTVVYLPSSYAEKVEALFKMDKSVQVIEIDTDIGLEATGKGIPYEWVVIAFREGEEMATLKRLKASRSRPTQLLLTSVER